MSRIAGVDPQQHPSLPLVLIPNARKMRNHQTLKLRTAAAMARQAPWIPCARYLEPCQEAFCPAP